VSQVFAVLPAILFVSFLFDIKTDVYRELNQKRWPNLRQSGEALEFEFWESCRFEVEENRETSSPRASTQQ